MVTLEGHAIVSTDGMIATADGGYPEELRNEADWSLYQADLDAAAAVIIGRKGHERHPNPGRLRLVLTRSVRGIERDPSSSLAFMWNPRDVELGKALAFMGVRQGVVAVTGLFDLFLADTTRFILSERHDLVMQGGRPCFSGGHPRTVLARSGMRPRKPQIIDAGAMVTRTVWAR